MTSVLIMLPAFEPTVQYVTQCADANLRFVALTLWLTNNNFRLCTREEHLSPDTLVANANYCAISDNSVSYILFQCLPTPDWPIDSPTPAPNFTVDIGDLEWVTVPAPVIIPPV